jgi:hypothetical protein
MQDAHHDIGLITPENSGPIGISLGWDHSSRHGDNPRMRAALGVGHVRTDGLEQFLAKPVAADSPFIAFYERNKATKYLAAETRLALVLDPDHAAELRKSKPEFYRLPFVHVKDGKPHTRMATAWDEREFCIRAFGDEERQMLREIHAGLIAGDVLVSRGGGGNPFSHASLSLTLLSRVPQQWHDDFAKATAEVKRLQAAVEATGIHAKLEAAGCGAFALKPEWSNFFKSIIRTKPDGTDTTYTYSTAHEVVFFLNPKDQEGCNFGWYTVEELEAWTRGEGPIIKNREVAA